MDDILAEVLRRTYMNKAKQNGTTTVTSPEQVLEELRQKNFEKIDKWRKQLQVLNQSIEADGCKIISILQIVNGQINQSIDITVK